MRIVSLLPALTELVFLLGRGDELVGVSHECDHPIDAPALPRLTSSRVDSLAPSASIDEWVATEGGALYSLDEEALVEARPDLILTQSQCSVCAIAEGTVRACASRLSGEVRIETVNPLDLAGVFSMFLHIGDVLERRDRAQELILEFEELSREVERRRVGLEAPRVVLLEWTDPPYTGGHWNPDLVALAGGLEVLGLSGDAARRVSWSEVVAARPEVLIVAPCGFTLARTERELPSLMSREEWMELPAVRRGLVTIADGSSYFARPGPRLLESLGVTAAAVDPERCADLAPLEGWRRLDVVG